MSCDGLVTRPGCIPGSRPVSAGLACIDGWIIIVFSQLQGNFWQQPMLFDRSLWTFLTSFNGYACANSVILLLHFSSLSFLEPFSLLSFSLLSQPFVVVQNGPQDETITVLMSNSHHLTRRHGVVNKLMLPVRQQ